MRYVLSGGRDYIEVCFVRTRPEKLRRIWFSPLVALKMGSFKPLFNKTPFSRTHADDPR
jgi:hypothetical protein